MGFDLLAGGKAFKTVLAIDIEDAMVRAYNANHANSARIPICRKIDISDFITDAEVLALYLDHLAEIENNKQLRQRLNALPKMRLEDFTAQIANLDSEFLARVAGLRENPEFLRDYRRLDSQVLSQTSIIGFHAALKLPSTTSSRTPELGPLIWAGHVRLLQQSSGAIAPELTRLQEVVEAELSRLWAREVEALRERSISNGRGQLASSGSRIAAFVEFLETKGMQSLRREWLSWRSKRDALRFYVFGDADVLGALRDIYNEGNCASVILGGPPCQGFSRIGRGKIRSLREDRVHVHYDENAGDVRNRLLHKYVLFVSALAPDVFLFENVRHFQSSVKTSSGTFLATEALATAIQDISEHGPAYNVAQRIVTASDHMVPQSRERFFMIGIKAELGDEMLPKWCLNLPVREHVPLSAALDGLPQPCFVDDRGGDISPIARTFSRCSNVLPAEGATAMYRAWVEQPLPPGLPNRSNGVFDAHCARPARQDDADFFELLGPGKRWMDYRADESTTLAELRGVLASVVDALQNSEESRSGLFAELSLGRIQGLLGKLDGSLPLRLLLETIDPLPGELEHHLLTPNYLAKREGKHGDWLARLHPDEPCKTIVTHMGKDTYAYVHPSQPRTLSIREAARVQTFPDWFRLGDLSLVDAFRVLGNAVPPFLANQFAERIARVLWAQQTQQRLRPMLARA